MSVTTYVRVCMKANGGEKERRAEGKGEERESRGDTKMRVDRRDCCVTLS